MLPQTRIRFVSRLAPLVTLLVVLCVRSASSQTMARVSVAGSVGRLSMNADHVDGRDRLFGVSIAVPLKSFVDLEAELARSGRFTRQYDGSSTSFAPPGSTREEIERLSVLTRFIKRRESRWLGSIGVAFHSPRAARLQPRLFVGLTGHQVVDHTEVQSLRVPPGVTQDEVDRVTPGDSAWSRNVGGVTIGGGVRIGLSSRLWIAPDVRYDYGSIGDEINNALRTTVRVGWRF